MKTQDNRFNRFRHSIFLLIFLLLAMPPLQGAVQAQNKQHGGSAQTAVSTEKPAGVVNINTATEQELTRLPGIGPSRAKAILELRGRLGRFKQAEDLMRVRGIGRKTFRMLSPMLALEGTTTLTAKTTGIASGKPGQGPTPPATKQPATKNGK